MAKTAPDDEPIRVAPLHALVDDRVIAHIENAQLRVSAAVKHHANPLFGEAQPWEVRFDNMYPNVAHDPVSDEYRLWYSPFIIDRATSNTPRPQRVPGSYRVGREQAKADAPEQIEREMGVCYASSPDGLSWTKPSLGLVAYDGSTDNNIVMRRAHGAGVLHDPHEIDPQRRYKMLARFRRAEGGSQMGVAFSGDGLRWSEPVLCPQINTPGDTHNNVLSAARRNRYVGFTRLRDPETNERIVGRTESEDFINWTPAAEVLRGSPRRQPYTMIVFPWAQVYLGLVSVFEPETDRVTCELAWSPDSLDWRWLEPGRPLIDTGARSGEHDWGCVYPAAHPIATDGEIRIYYGASDGPHTDWRNGFLALATLPPHRFVGYTPIDADRAATLLTQPMLADHDTICLHASCDALGGSVRVTGIDATGREVLRSEPITGVVTEQAVAWEPGTDTRAIAGQILQWRFELENATLYAIGFAGA